MKSRSTPRRYRMTRRAASVDDTRRRITEAAVRLHTTVGPANTSIASVAGEAGVTRLTVYRHFDNLEALFAACRAHWRAANPPPDPSRWATILDTDVRAREAFTDMYGWFRDHADELRPIYRDIDAMPASSRAATRADTIALASLVCGPDLPGETAVGSVSRSPATSSTTAHGGRSRSIRSCPTGSSWTSPSPCCSRSRS